jgi:2-phospho-L-lactate guanylyltransferase
VVQALVPLKDLVQAKSRLAGLLRPSERRALAQAMVEDVLEALSATPAIQQIVLVSDDPAGTLLAARYGAHCWVESELQCRGLNALVARASERLLARRGGPLLVLHGDLPLLAADDITAALSLLERSGGLVVGSDRDGRGTNLLAFEARSMPAFRFGPDSCRKHLAWARSAGVPAHLLQREGVALDVDEPADLAALMDALDRRGGGHTAALLADSPLGERIRLALATLAGAVEAAGDCIGRKPS